MPRTDPIPAGEEPGALLIRLRERAPLVHAITSPVSAPLVANALAAIGARPVLAEDPEEIAEVAAGADALTLNIGMLTAPRRDAMAAALAARRAETGWVLDPVGAGGASARTRAAAALALEGPSVIRGNASEILRLHAALIGAETLPVYGVDARDPVEAAVGSAARLAAATGAVSALSGATDAISDGGRVLRLRRGHPTMARSVGVGCALSALCAAFLGTGASAWDAAVAACLTAGLAGESAAATARGPGGFPAAWLDAMALLGAEDLNAAAGEAIDDARA